MGLSDELYKRLILGEQLKNDCDKLCFDKLHFPVILEFIRNIKEEDFKQVRKSFLVEAGELLFCVGINRIVLIKKMKDNNYDKIFIYARRYMKSFGHREVKIGIGKYAAAPEELRLSYLSAELALEGADEKSPALGIQSYEKIRLRRLLAALPFDTKLSLIKECLKVEAVKELDWKRLEFINSFVEVGFNITDTAMRNHIDRKQVHKLVNEYSKELGKDLFDFSAAVEFKLAYTMAELLKEKIIN